MYLAWHGARRVLCVLASTMGFPSSSAVGIRNPPPPRPDGHDITAHAQSSQLAAAAQVKFRC